MYNYFEIYSLSIFVLFFIALVSVISYGLKPFRKGSKHRSSSIALKLTFIVYLALYCGYLYSFLRMLPRANDFKLTSLGYLELNIIIIFFITLLPVLGITMRRLVDKENRSNYNILFTVINIVSILIMISLILLGAFGLREY